MTGIFFVYTFYCSSDILDAFLEMGGYAIGVKVRDWRGIGGFVEDLRGD